MNDSGDVLRLRLTFLIAAAGVAAVLIAFFAAVIAFHDADNPGEVIPAVLGVGTAAIGTLAGLVAGHTAGAAGRERAEDRAQANAHDAAAGRALAETLKAEGAAADGGEDGLPGTRGGPPTATDAVSRHAAIARSLFP